MPTNYVTAPDGTQIAWERSGTGPALILVDGAAMHRRFGTSPAVARLLCNTFSVVTYDRRGRGESGDTSPWSLDREVEDLLAVMEVATADVGDEQVAVHTLSSAGVLALLAAARSAPIQALSMFEPPIDLDGDRVADTAHIDNVTALVRAERRREAVQAFQTGIGMPAEMIAQQPPDVLNALDAIAPTLVYDLMLSQTGTIDRAVLGSVTVPVQVISSDTGSGPLGGWAAALAAALPAGRHRTLPGSWHGVSEEVLTAAIRDFVTTAAGHSGTPS